MLLFVEYIVEQEKWDRRFGLLFERLIGSTLTRVFNHMAVSQL